MKTTLNRRKNRCLELLLILLVFSGSSALFAQGFTAEPADTVDFQYDKDALAKKIKYAPRFGLTLANHKQKSEIGNSENKRKAILGFMAGLGLTKPINSNLSVESGLFLTQKGSKSKEDGFSDGEEYYSYSDILRMLYIDIPLVARYTLFEEGEGGLAFYAGLQPSFLLQAKQKNKTATDEDTQTVTDSFNKFDAAATIGVGYLFTNGLQVNLNYDHGFTDIIADSTPNGSNYFKSYNRVLKFSIAWQLGEK